MNSIDTDRSIREPSRMDRDLMLQSLPLLQYVQLDPASYVNRPVLKR